MNLFAIPPLISAALFLLLGFLCFKQKNRPFYAVIFSLLCLATAGWQFSWFILFNLSDAFWANILVRAGYSVIIFISVFYYHFIVEFLGRSKTSAFDRRLLIFSYLSAGVFEILLWRTNYFINGYYSYFWGYYPKANSAHLIYLFALSIQAIRGLYLLLAFARQKQGFGRMKTQANMLFLALLIYFFAAIDFLVNYGIGFYPPGVIFILFTLSITLYAITKHNLMDISVVIGRTAAHILTAMFLATGYVAFLLIYRKYVSASIDAWFVVGTVLYGVFVGEYFQRIRLHVQTTAEKLILTGRYDYSRVLKTISRDLSKPMTIEEINKTIDNRLRELMDVRSAGIVRLK